MTKAFSLRYSLDTLAALLAVVGFLGVLQTFIVGRHYIIPTGLLFLAIIFGNLARFGYRDAPFARHLLFWNGVLITCHAFFGLFWAHTPREILGPAFLPVYGAIFLIVGGLTVHYGRHHRLFGA